MNIVFPPVLQYRAATHPERTAYIFEGVEFTYRQYYDNALHAAAYLQSKGLKKGDRIGILDINNHHVVHLITGAMLIGVIPVSVNWRAMPPEILFIVQDAGIQHFFYGAAFTKLIQATPFNETEVIPVETIPVTGFAENAADLSDVPGEDECCVILYTSGTTGNPKGVMLSYRNIYACYQLCAWDTPSFGPDAVNLVCGPMYSIFGFGAFFACIYAGATNVLLRMFDAGMICKSIEQYKITNAVLVPVMFKMILAIEGVDKMDFSSLKHIQYGGSPVSPDILQKISKLFPCYFTQVYGLTETAGVATALRFDDHNKMLHGLISNFRVLLSAGKAGLGIDIEIRDEAGNAAETGAPGEVFIKGENVALGYWNNPAITDKTFGVDGWFATGDIGYVDDEGYLFLVDRKNDMIVCKGANIYPAEIEKVLEAHPLIKEVAIIGTPDEKAGEAVCAVIVWKETALTLEDIQQWCVGKMSDFKIPKRIETANELPRNPTGKIMRRLVREPFWKDEQRMIRG